MNLRGQKQGVQKRAYTARRNRRLRAEQRKRKKSGKKPIALPGLFYIVP